MLVFEANEEIAIIFPFVNYLIVITLFVFVGSNKLIADMIESSQKIMTYTIGLTY